MAYSNLHELYIINWFWNNCSAEETFKLYEDIDEDFVLEYVLEDEDEVVIAKCPLMLLPFREDWLPTFNNLDYVLVDELLWLTVHWLLLEAHSLHITLCIQASLRKHGSFSSLIINILTCLSQCIKEKRRQQLMKMKMSLISLLETLYLTNTLKNAQFVRKDLKHWSARNLKQMQHFYASFSYTLNMVSTLLQPKLEAREQTLTKLVVLSSNDEKMEEVI